MLTSKDILDHSEVLAFVSAMREGVHYHPVASTPRHLWTNTPGYYHSSGLHGRMEHHSDCSRYTAVPTSPVLLDQEH